MHQLLDAFSEGAMGGDVNHPPLFIGLGSPHGDDRAGWLVIERLHELGIPPETARAAHHPAKIWDWRHSEAAVIIVDACQEHGPPGSFMRWAWPRDVLPTTRCSGTHDLPLAEVLAIGQRLGFFPEEITVWTISGDHYDEAADASPAVVRAARLLADQLASACHRLTTRIDH
jgi:hydrogenase maturation protease